MVDTCPFCAMFWDKIKRPDDWQFADVNLGEIRIASFTPLDPVTPGHRLFVPQYHLETASITPEVTGKAFMHAAFWGKSQNRDYNLIVNAGSTATQTVPHLHVHYVPRHKDDGLALPWYSGKGNHK